MAIENALLYQEAQQAVAVRDRVLAIVSHDLRNQLGVVKMGIHLLARKVETAAEKNELRKPIDTIDRTADSMQHLVTDLVDMAALQAGKLAVELQPLVVAEILEQVGHSHELIAAAKDVKLTVHPIAADVRVMADRERLLQVLANLLGNAIKFTNAGGSVTLRASAGDKDVTIAVVDTGTGIPAEHLDRIFDPYQSLQQTEQRGTGLGLYISKGIVLHHGGHLGVESTVGTGSTFTITLPRLEH
jgi:signal transduction histidine kinase